MKTHHLCALLLLCVTSMQAYADIVVSPPPLSTQGLELYNTYGELNSNSPRFDTIRYSEQQGRSRPALMLAGTTGTANGHKAADTTVKNSEPMFKESLFTQNKMHKYLGIGSLALATLAVLSPKPEEDEVTGDYGIHEQLAKGSALLGLAAVGSGLYLHWDDIDLKNGWGDPDNQHALWSTLGAIGFLVAISVAPDEGHVAPAALGYASMLVGIKYTW